MKHRSFLAALLCGAVLLSGCGSSNSPAGPSAPGAAERQPLSELEQLAQQVEAWEAAGDYDDETAYRSALLRTVELARAADRGAYRCEDPQELGEEKLEALASAANACNYAYSIFVDYDSFGEDLHETIAMLLIYMDDSPSTDVCYNLSGTESDVLPMRNYYIVPEDEWTPADPDHGYTYGDAWNVIPADELEAAFQRRFGIDLTANDRAWMRDTDFILTDYSTGGPMLQFDGETYIVYLRGIGYVDFPYESSLIYHYDGTYTAVFTPTSSAWIGYGCPDPLRLRNIGTEEVPYFQLLGYALPA